VGPDLPAGLMDLRATRVKGGTDLAFDHEPLGGVGCSGGSWDKVESSWRPAANQAGVRWASRRTSCGQIDERPFGRGGDSGAGRICPASRLDVDPIYIRRLPAGIRNPGMK
jgi:hypothetical protein